MFLTTLALLCGCAHDAFQDWIFINRDFVQANLPASSQFEKGDVLPILLKEHFNVGDGAQIILVDDEYAQHQESCEFSGIKLIHARATFAQYPEPERRKYLYELIRECRLTVQLTEADFRGNIRAEPYIEPQVVFPVLKDSSPDADDSESSVAEDDDTSSIESVVIYAVNQVRVITLGQQTFYLHDAETQVASALVQQVERLSIAVPNF